MGKELGRIREMIELPFKYPAIFQHLGIEPPKGVLLCGPPGTGKMRRLRMGQRPVEAALASAIFSSRKTFAYSSGKHTLWFTAGLNNF